MSNRKKAMRSLHFSAESCYVQVCLALKRLPFVVYLVALYPPLSPAGKEAVLLHCCVSFGLDPNPMQSSGQALHLRDSENKWMLMYFNTFFIKWLD